MAQSRRRFLKNSAGFTAGCCALGATALLEACSPTKFVGYTQEDTELLVKLSDMGDEKFVVLNHPSLQAPIYLKKTDKDHFDALLMLCTHKGCDVKPAGAIMVCPCHGSQFLSTGEVLRGPATERLAEFPVTLDKNFIRIKIG